MQEDALVSAAAELLARFDRTEGIHAEDYYLMVKHARPTWEHLRRALAARRDGR